MEILNLTASTSWHSACSHCSWPEQRGEPLAGAPAALWVRPSPWPVPQHLASRPHKATAGDMLSPGRRAEFRQPAHKRQRKVHVASELSDECITAVLQGDVHSRDGVTGTGPTFLPNNKKTTKHVKPGYSRRWPSGYKEPQSLRDGNTQGDCPSWLPGELPDHRAGRGPSWSPADILSRGC